MKLTSFLQPREIVLWVRRYEVVTRLAGEVQKLLRDHRANRVNSAIL